jgi:outer membrane protein assembly factor BamB
MSSGRAWAGLGAALILSAGLPACGSGGPAPLSISCSGPTLTSPDSADVNSNGPVIPPPVTAVPGTPKAVSTAQVSLPDAVDPDNPLLGYQGGHGFSLSLISDTGVGQPVWTAELRAPSSVSGSDSSLYAPDTHYGYAIMEGGSLRAQYITAVSSDGQQGPACVVPQSPSAADDVELLPHAGVLIAQNPLNPAGTGDFRLDGYSTSAGQRLWSVPTGTPFATGKVKYMLAGDTVYVWDDGSGAVAAYSALTGQHLWTTSLNSDPFSSDDGLLGVFGGRVYAAFDDGTTVQVAAIDGVHGTISWKVSFPSPEAISSVGVTQVGTGEVLLGDTQRHQMLLLRAKNGAVLTKASSASPGAAVENQEIQVCSPGGHLAVAVPESGAIHVLSDDPAYDRTITIPKGNILDIAVTATEAYVLPAQAGAPVYGYDLATGKLLWTVPVPPGGSSDTLLYAFDGGFMLQGSAQNAVYR